MFTKLTIRQQHALRFLNKTNSGALPRYTLSKSSEPENEKEEEVQEPRAEKRRTKREKNERKNGVPPTRGTERPNGMLNMIGGLDNITRMASLAPLAMDVALGHKISFESARACTQTYFDRFHELNVSGLDNIPSDGAVLVIVNLRSWLDLLAVFASLPRRATFLLSGVPATVKRMDKMMKSFVSSEIVLRGLHFKNESAADEGEETGDEVDKAWAKLADGEIVVVCMTTEPCKRATLRDLRNGSHVVSDDASILESSFIHLGERLCIVPAFVAGSVDAFESSHDPLTPAPGSTLHVSFKRSIECTDTNMAARIASGDKAAVHDRTRVLLDTILTLESS